MKNLNDIHQEGQTYIPCPLKGVDGSTICWHAAFSDGAYGDYVIEFAKKFDSAEEVCQAVEFGIVYPGMFYEENQK